MIQIVVFLFWAIPAFAAPAPPEAVPGGMQAALSLRAFLDGETFSYLGELQGIRETSGRSFESVTLGSYYHLSPHLKFGLFASREFGLRHDEDWHSVSGKWSWNNTNHRGETLVAADVTGREVLADNWVGELKVRYIFNSFNDDRTLLVRPGLTYFFMKDGNLVANLFFHFEMDFPLNYSAQYIDEKWIYIGSLYHISENWDLGPNLILGWQTWSRPDAFAQKGGAPYSITTQTTTLGLLAVLHF